MNSSQSMQHGESSTSAMFAPNAPMVVTGGTFHVTHTKALKRRSNRHRRMIQDSFKDHIALDVTHDTNDPFNPPRCHPKTRTAVLQKLADWALSTDHSNLSHILWLFGPAEVGKSAIAGSFADALSKEGRLAASFFFRQGSDGAGGGNLEKVLVPTIAFQMAHYIPELQRHIASAVEKNPLIFHQSPETQVEQLIITPVLSSSMGYDFPRMVIIDGLDKCHNRDTQRRILAIIGDAAPRLAGRIKFLILSRPEPPIASAFNLPALKSITLPMDLMDDLSVFDDIRAFLKDGFEQIKVTCPLQAADIDSSWREEHLIELLVFRSYGTFGYAHTALELVLEGPVRAINRPPLFFFFLPNLKA